MLYITFSLLVKFRSKLTQFLYIPSEHLHVQKSNRNIEKGVTDVQNQQSRREKGVRNVQSKKTSEKGHSDVFNVSFELILHLLLVFL